MVLLHLKAIFMLVCLKRLVIFLICGEAYVNVVHLVSCLRVVGVSAVSFFSILCFRLVIRLLGKLFLWAICSILPFFMALFLWDGEGEHSVDEESVSC